MMIASYRMLDLQETLTVIGAYVIAYVIVAGVPIWLYVAQRRSMKRLLKSLRESGIDIDQIIADHRSDHQ